MDAILREVKKRRGQGFQEEFDFQKKKVISGLADVLSGQAGRSSLTSELHEHPKKVTLVRSVRDLPNRPIAIVNKSGASSHSFTWCLGCPELFYFSAKSGLG